MKITRISVYRRDLPYVGGTYGWGRNNVIDTARTTVVAVDTDDARPPRRPPDDICNIVWLVGGGDVVGGGRKERDTVDRTISSQRTLARQSATEEEAGGQRASERERARESDFLLLNMVDGRSVERVKTLSVLPGTLGRVS